VGLAALQISVDTLKAKGVNPDRKSQSSRMGVERRADNSTIKTILFRNPKLNLGRTGYIGDGMEN
jgi:hypothetical protein